MSCESEVRSEVRLEDGYIYLKYTDETWGSCRHWQTIYSIREVESEAEAMSIIEARDNDFKPAWEFEEVEIEWNDSRKNRHRNCTYRAKLDANKLYLLRVYQKVHPSCNRGRWYRRFAYYLIRNASEVTLLEEKVLRGI